MKQITNERAEQIALAIIKHTWPKRGLDLSDRFKVKLEKLAEQIGPEGHQDHYLACFYAQELLPLAFERFAEVKIEVKIHHHTSVKGDYNEGAIALALLKAEGINLQPAQFKTRMAVLVAGTGIPFEELVSFYSQEIIPRALSSALGWPSCHIIADGEDDGL